MPHGSIMTRDVAVIVVEVILCCLLSHFGVLRAYAAYSCPGFDVNGHEIDSIVSRSNCSVIEGSLSIRDVNFGRVSPETASALRQVVEVSEYVVFHNVSGLNSLGNLLPRLAVIRGVRLFAGRYALAIVNTELIDIGLRNLVLVQNGAITAFDNVQLCLYTINWRLLFNKPDVKVANDAYRAVEDDVYLHNNAPPNFCLSKRDCSSSCINQQDWKKSHDRTYSVRESQRRLDETTSCWNAISCQKQCPEECGFACGEYDLRSDRRATITTNVTCCNAECLGGCAGDGPDSCLVCKNVWHAGRCVSECPPDTVRFLHRCITSEECFQMRASDDGDGNGDTTYRVINDRLCVSRCPADSFSDGRYCRPCFASANTKQVANDAAECPRTCAGALIASLSDAQQLAGCTVVNGSLTIRIGYDSFSIMNPDAFSVQKELKMCFRRLRVITGRLRVIRSHVLTSLEFLNSLQVIEGRSTVGESNSDYAFTVIDNENLEMVWGANETRELRVDRGKVLVQMNPNLCPDKVLAFQKAANISEILAVDTNGLGRTCRTEDAEDGLVVEVQSVKPTSISLLWRRTLPPDVSWSEKTGNHRFLGYIVYYKPYAFQNLTEADYAHISHSAFAPASNGNVKAWNILTTGGNTQVSVNNLLPYTQYAFYVLRLANSREWTRVSDFLYERTKASKPSRPRILNNPEQSVNEQSDKVTVNVNMRWLEPAQPNGKVVFYLIHVEKHEMQIDPDIIRKQCTRQTPNPADEVTTMSTTSTTTTTTAAAGYSYNHSNQNEFETTSLAMQCSRFEQTNCLVTRETAAELYSDFENLRLSPVKVASEKTVNFEAQQVSARYDEFDDQLSADMLERVEIEVNRPQAVDETINLNHSGMAFDHLFDFLHEVARGTGASPTKVDDDVPDTPGDTPSTTSKDLFLERLETADEFRRLLHEKKLYIHDNAKELSATLRNLEIFTKYTIKIFACQNYSKLNNVLVDQSPRIVSISNASTPISSATATTMKKDAINNTYALLMDVSKNDGSSLNEICSKPATLADDFTTRGLIERDSILRNTISISSVDSDFNARISWLSPKQPNGIVLFYEIEIRSKLSTPQIYCHPAVSLGKGAIPVEFDVKFPHCGDYEFKLRAASLWGLGYWTEPVPFNISCNAAQNLSPELTYSLSIVLPILAVTLTVILVSRKICKERKRKRAAVTTVNPDYIDNFYVPDEWEVKRERVTTVRKLGAGTFGEVYEGTFQNSRDRQTIKVAIKTMRGASLRDSVAFLNEASIMKEFTDCFHIVKLLGIVSQGQPVMVLMELMSNGDLKTFLRRHRPDSDDSIGRPPPSFTYLFQAASQIADGMAFLADRKFVHRDLAARNCLVSEDFVVKIGDFGLARDIYESDYYRKEQKGPLPIRWMAPESLADGLFDSRSDVWAYGIVLWEMATLGEQPYQGMANEDVLRYVRDGKTLSQPDGCDFEFYEMMRLCWARRPADRPTFIKILQLLQPHFDYTFTTVSWYQNRFLKGLSSLGPNDHTAAQIVVHS